jgi:hypothetical protein
MLRNRAASSGGGMTDRMIMTERIPLSPATDVRGNLAADRARSYSR